MAVVRELTKKFEEVKRGTAADLICFYQENGAPKGEIVLVIENTPTLEPLSAQEIEARLQLLLQTQSVNEAAKILHAETGLSKKELYARALALKG